jgi:zinc protease
MRAPPIDGLRVELPHRTFTLDNGLHVAVHEDATLPLVCVNVWYRVGSKDERAGRTGFAHLFEHLMFEGSANVPPGRFDAWLEDAGGTNNGSTTPDRTNYWITVPSSALELALFLESDRMGWLDISADKLEAQRAVVMNERRESYENRPYGLAYETLLAAAYPPGHPYAWPTIGYMKDIAAATLADVHDFQRTYYTPSNALLAIAGDVRGVAVDALVARHFGAIPGASPPPLPTLPRLHLDDERRIVLEDDVTLPRVDMAWHTPPAFAGDDAALEIAARILAHGRASRLYRRLVHERQIAQHVTASQDSGLVGSLFYVSATARPGITPDTIEEALRTEIAALVDSPPDERSMARARHGVQTELVDALESVGGFGGKADRLNEYLFYTGDPGYIIRDVERYDAVQAAAVQRAATRWFTRPGVTLHVVPRRSP